MKKMDLTQDSILMIRQIYVNADRTDFIYINDKDDNCFQHPRVKMETFENRELSDLMWEHFLDLDAASEEFGELIEPLTIPELIDVMEDIGVEIIEKQN